jgi:hypothetical protein
MKRPINIIFMTVLVCTFVSMFFFLNVSAQSTAVRAEASTTQPQVGDILSINITISNGQNLFGVDVTFSWNPSSLRLISATPQLGVESHPGGVLHESSTFPIEFVNNDASQETAEYHLAATSTGASTPAFSGSGVIAIVKFTVTNSIDAGLTLDNVELSQLESDGSVNLVTPITSVDLVTPVTSGTSVTPAASSTPNVSPTVPEFNATAVIVTFIIITIVIATISKRILRDRQVID